MNTLTNTARPQAKTDDRRRFYRRPSVRLIGAAMSGGIFVHCVLPLIGAA